MKASQQEDNNAGGVGGSRRASVCRREEDGGSLPENWLVVESRFLLLLPPFSLPVCVSISVPSQWRYVCRHLSCFFSPPLVPSCPLSLPRARAALRLSANHGPGVDQNRARGLDRARGPDALASKQNRGARRLGGRSGPGSAGSETPGADQPFVFIGLNPGQASSRLVLSVKGVPTSRSAIYLNSKLPDKHHAADIRGQDISAQKVGLRALPLIGKLLTEGLEKTAPD